MSERPSAEIIPFPRHFQAILPNHDTIAPESPTQRLQRALATLTAAQAEQKAALARWRGAIGDLQVSMQGLGSSLDKYQNALGQISPNRNR